LQAYKDRKLEERPEVFQKQQMYMAMEWCVMRF
jgi:hypothetical protein